MGFCQTSACNNETDGNRKHCGTCRSKKYRSNDQVRYFLNNLRRSAIKRKIFFDLSLDEFRKWAIKEEFRFGIKAHRDRDSVDRKERHLGYTLSNIQKLTVSENSKKYQNYEQYNWKPINTSESFGI